ncbi:MAG: hypothetical protein A2Z05_00205 [Chloroflexi bacterium RBG_16_60_22]|nr:MAG: hypothetical protein A2Z05_00205 [Chloroflexi bacterium RBG_16_60_22]
MSGLEFLRQVNTGLRKAPGKKIAVIGGGNVATDVARTLLRLGAAPVVLYRRGRGEMPALKEEVDKAGQEGVKIQFLTLPVAASKKDGRIALECTRMELGSPDETGRPRPVPVKGSEFTLEFDAVMEALGEEPDLSILPEGLIDDYQRLKAGLSAGPLGGRFFAAGDFVSGPSTVAAAIAAGREAAGLIHRYPGGTKRRQAGSRRVPEKFNSAYLRRTSRVATPELSPAERVKSLDAEDTGGLEPAAVATEANRCFNCGCVAINPSDMAPALIAMGAKIKTTRRVVEAALFFDAGVDKTTVLDNDEIVVEIEVPAPGAGTRCKFIKTALRKSIDFPIVNCAAAIESRNGTVRSARICLNAVYTEPYRATAAEDYLKGKPISESTAAAAAEEVTAAAFPLLNNAYKIQIARALVKRAILGCG